MRVKTILFLATLVARPAAAASSPQAQVRAIFEKSLAEGVMHLPDGTTIVEPVPPSREALDAVRNIGDAALPVLAEELRSGSDRAFSLALRFIEAMGGKRVVPIMAEAAKTAPAPHRRQEALRWLVNITPADALPIAQDMAQTDPDQSVREAANAVIAQIRRK